MELIDPSPMGPRAVPSVISTVLKLALACLLVGLVLSLFNISPGEILRSLPNAVTALFERMEAALGWAAPYVVLGATIVLPVWLAGKLLRLIKRR